MIDTDKYEGHTEGPWTIELGNMEEYGETDTVMSSEGEVAMNVMRQDVALLADAPLLLAEVKRLREGRLDLINEVIRIINNKTGERVDADLHDYIIDRLVNE